MSGNKPRFNIHVSAHNVEAQGHVDLVHKILARACASIGETILHPPSADMAGTYLLSNASAAFKDNRPQMIVGDPESPYRPLRATCTTGTGDPTVYLETFEKNVATHPVADLQAKAAHWFTIAKGMFDLRSLEPEELRRLLKDIAARNDDMAVTFSETGWEGELYRGKVSHGAVSAPFSFGKYGHAEAAKHVVINAHGPRRMVLEALLRRAWQGTQDDLDKYPAMQFLPALEAQSEIIKHFKAQLEEQLAEAGIDDVKSDVVVGGSTGQDQFYGSVRLYSDNPTDFTTVIGAFPFQLAGLPEDDLREVVHTFFVKHATYMIDAFRTPVIPLVRSNSYDDLIKLLFSEGCWLYETFHRLGFGLSVAAPHGDIQIEGPKPYTYANNYKKYVSVLSNFNRFDASTVSRRADVDEKDVSIADIISVQYVSAACTSHLKAQRFFEDLQTKLESDSAAGVYGRGLRGEVEGVPGVPLSVTQVVCMHTAMVGGKLACTHKASSLSFPSRIAEQLADGGLVVKVTAIVDFDGVKWRRDFENVFSPLALLPKVVIGEYNRAEYQHPDVKQQMINGSLAFELDKELGKVKAKVSIGREIARYLNRVITNQELGLFYCGLTVPVLHRVTETYGINWAAVGAFTIKTEAGVGASMSVEIKLIDADGVSWIFTHRFVLNETDLGMWKSVDDAKKRSAQMDAGEVVDHGEDQVVYVRNGKKGYISYVGRKPTAKRAMGVMDLNAEKFFVKMRAQNDELFADVYLTSNGRRRRIVPVVKVPYSQQ